MKKKLIQLYRQCLINKSMPMCNLHDFIEYLEKIVDIEEKNKKNKKIK